MPLITISHSLGSADRGIARSVAKELRVELFDDQKLKERALQRGIQPEDLKGLDERAPGFFDRFLNTKPESFLDLMESVVYDIARRGEGVIVGHGSQFLLRDFGCALHVLIHASRPYRVQQIMEQQHLSREGAEKMIDKSDNEKKGFFHFAFNMNWESPSLYDLIINTGKIGNESTVNIILETARSDEIKACSLTALETMERLSQERAIRSTLLNNNLNLSLLHLEVPQKGTAVLRGFVYSDGEKQHVVELVKAVAGITEVQSELSVLEYLAV
jgi:cytidylate kinase